MASNFSQFEKFKKNKKYNNDYIETDNKNKDKKKRIKKNKYYSEEDNLY